MAHILLAGDTSTLSPVRMPPDRTGFAGRPVATSIGVIKHKPLKNNNL
jgi:hypothetical protein